VAAVVGRMGARVASSAAVGAGDDVVGSCGRAASWRRQFDASGAAFFGRLGALRTHTQSAPASQSALFSAF